MTIETDLTTLIPNSYVSETAERLALCRKLDDIKDEVELQKFNTEVTDRFGPIPQQVTELMEAIRLRWLGQQIGLEKMVLKKQTLIGTFIADQKHSFFASDMFHLSCAKFGSRKSVLSIDGHLRRFHGVFCHTTPFDAWLTGIRLRRQSG